MTRTERMKAAIAAKPLPTAAAPAKPSRAAPAVPVPAAALTPEAHPAKPVGLAPSPTPNNLAKRPRQRLPRLPDGSRFAMSYRADDAVNGTWSGSLTIAAAEGEPLVFQARALTLFGLCIVLDRYYRRHLSEQAEKEASAS